MKTARVAVMPALGICAVMFACGGCAATSPDFADIAGTYAGVSANGQTPPIAIPINSTNGACTRNGMSGSVTLTSSGRFTATYAYRDQNCFTQRSGGTIGGSFSRSGAALVFSPDSGIDRTHPFGSITGTISGNTLTVHGVAPPSTAIDIIARRP